MDAGELGYSIYFFWWGVDVTILQIVEDSVVEEDCILKPKERNQMFAFNCLLRLNLYMNLPKTILPRNNRSEFGIES